MRTHYIVLAIPAFLILIVFEYLYTVLRKKHIYSLGDSVNNISTGTLEQVASAFLKALLFIPYLFIYHHFALFNISSQSVLMWGLAWLVSDFFYYWLHRAMHRITFFWAGHSVHHQSDHYNLSVALRQGIIQTCFGWLFYLPVALLGFPPVMFATVSSMNTLYQFWLHTPIIKKLGFLEYIINTPSHHRVHHGKNAQYIDKNYAGSLIIWDKLFGTFEPEVAEVSYGVTEPLDSWCPFYANIKVLKDTWHYSQPLNNLKKRLLCFIKPPEWVVEQIGTPAYLALKPKTLPLSCHKTLQAYLVLNLVLLIVTGFLCFYTFDIHTHLSQGLVLYVVMSLLLLGHSMNAGKYVLLIENLRLIIFLSFMWPLLQVHFSLIAVIMTVYLFNMLTLVKSSAIKPQLS